MEDSVKMGEANASLIPRLKRWCSQLDVELVSAGLLAEMTGLPIGMLQVVCQHATKGLQGWNLREIAAYFVAENCRNCPFHEELGPDNAGRDILRETEQVREARAKSAESHSPAKIRLNGLVSGDLTSALRTAPTTEQSVLELVALLEDDDHSGDAVEKLRQASNLAPEFFSDLACEVIAEHIADISKGGKCAEILKTLGSKRGKLPTVAVRAAMRCVEMPFCHDEVLTLLADYLAEGGDLPHVATVARIIGHQAYGAESFIPAPMDHHYPGLIRVLSEIGQRDLVRLAHAFEKRLENPEKAVRVGTSVTLRRMTSIIPALGPMLSEVLIASLSLDDDRYGRSADVEATDALADIFVREPTDTQAKLAAAFVRVDDEAKELIFRVYRSVAEAARRSHEESEHAAMAVQCLPEVLDAIISATTSFAFPLKVREEAAETIEWIASDHPPLVLPRLDGILGAIAIVSREAVDFSEANPGNNPILSGFPRTESLSYDAIARNLASTLKELAEYAPVVVWRSIEPLLQSLRVGDETEAVVKARLIHLFVTFARNHTTAPALIPELFKALMAMESVLIRATALEVIRDLLLRAPELIPDNMRDMVVIYLRDPYVAVHSNAARAAIVMPMSSVDQVIEVAQLLFSQYCIHAREGGAWLCRDLSEGLVKLSRPDLRSVQIFALRALLKQCQDVEFYVVRDALDAFEDFVSLDPAFAEIYVRELLKFFERFPGRNDQQSYSREHQLFLSLFEQPESAIRKNLKQFRDAIRATAKSAPFEALQLISALLYFECFDDAADAAAEVKSALPIGARHEVLRLQAELTEIAARVEAKVAIGESASGLAELRASETVLKRYDTHSKQNKTDAIIEALTVADRVAERLE